MLDIHLITQDKGTVEANLRQRDPSISLDHVIELEKQRAAMQRDYDSLRQQINTRGKEIAKMPKDSPQFLTSKNEMRAVSDRATQLGDELGRVRGELETELLALPNMVRQGVPISDRKEDKEIVHAWGEKPAFDYKPLDHVALGERLGILDFERGVKIAESGFPVYVGKGALLEWALINHMVRNAVSHGFNFMLLPLLNNTKSLMTTGNLPKFAEELYSCQRDDLHLIPTAETPITNFHRDETLPADSLPVRIASYSPCFRREAGSHGKLARGLMRLHQFNKLESYSICLPEQTQEEHKMLIENGERILKDLGLHFRLANLPSCDLAQQSSQTFDIEIWLPCLGQYSEVSSASNCGDYQARRANIRFKGDQGRGFAYTLNCSALATPRVMIALLESNQTPDGHVVVPEVLRRDTGFDVI